MLQNVLAEFRPLGFAALLLLASDGYGAQIGTVVGAEEARVEPPGFNTDNAFSESIDVDDGAMVIGGVQFFQEKVYVYRRNASAWNLEVELEGDPTVNAQGIGSAVAISGNRVVAGARLDGMFDFGTTYVFAKNGTSWQQEDRFSAGTVKQGDEFGNAVAIDGDTLIVGSWKDDELTPTDNSSNSGSAYIFVRNGGDWEEQAQLISDDLAADDRFGEAVAIHGDTCIVGAPGHDGGFSESGAAYVFVRNGTTWSQEAKLVPSQPSRLGRFARTVAISGDSVVCGRNSGGGATIFRRTGTSWAIEVTLNAASDTFGQAADIDGDRCVVGDRTFQAPIFTRGAVFVYERSGASWQLAGRVAPSTDGFNSNQFGATLALDGEQLVVGQPDDSNGRGHAYRLEKTEYAISCFGNGNSAAEDCQLCQCGNTSPKSELRGCRNGAGLASKLLATGDASLQADTLRFEASGALPSSFGILISGDDLLPLMATTFCPAGVGIQAPQLDGLRCVGNSALRHGPRASAADGSIGITTPGWGFPDAPAQGLAADGGFAVGQTRHFQLFYRDDPFVGCGTGQNTSNAVSVRFLP